MSDEVLVGCKLPHGLYIEVGKQQILLNGVKQSGRMEAPFFMAPNNAVGLTKVPRDFWEAWVKNYQEFTPYKEGLIFAADKKKRVLDEAKEKEDLKNGLERLDTSKMPNTLKQVKAGAVA